MSHTVMLWLVNPGLQFFETEAISHSSGEERASHPGAKSGINEPPAFTRLVYGSFEREQDAQAALEEVSQRLADNRPLRVEMPTGRIFVVPTARVHYVVMAQLEANGVAESDVIGVVQPLHGLNTNLAD